MRKTARKIFALAVCMIILAAVCVFAAYAAELPAGATVSGHSTKMLDGMKIVDTYWAYYAETKTLEFVSNSTSYMKQAALRTAMFPAETGSNIRMKLNISLPGRRQLRLF